MTLYNKLKADEWDAEGLTQAQRRERAKKEAGKPDATGEVNFQDWLGKHPQGERNINKIYAILKREFAEGGKRSSLGTLLNALARAVWQARGGRGNPKADPPVPSGATDPIQRALQAEATRIGLERDQEKGENKIEGFVPLEKFKQLRERLKGKLERDAGNVNRTEYYAWLTLCCYTLTPALRREWEIGRAHV